MKNTCLYPFYEYIFKNFISKEELLPEYEDKTDIPVVVPTGIRVELDKRKKYIWKETRRLQAIKNKQELVEEIQKLKKDKSECHLCLSCECCEKYFWEQLERAFITQDKKVLDEKCEFLIPDEVNKLLEQKDKPADIYIDFYKRRNFTESNYLLMLKGFSSSTPILLNYAKNTNMYTGGGFYIRWNGFGIAVDPGYLFVQNLHNYGLTVFDIDAVIVTHEHIDHSSDIRVLDDLHQNVASKYREDDYNWNKTEFSISRQRIPGHKIKWYMDRVSYEQAVLLSERESGFNSAYNELYCVKANDLGQIEYERYDKKEIKNDKENAIKLSDNIRLKVFPTKHEQYKKDGEKFFFNHTFGCVFECYDKFNKKRVIGYTSDTSLQEDMVDKMYELLKECQVIISNISGIYKEDIMLKVEKERHLGYYGCYKIINNLLQREDCKLRYFLLSEFSNMVSDIRYGVSKYMQKEANWLAEYYKKRRIAILPAEIGLIVNLTEIKTKCTLCGKFAEKIYILKPVKENNKLQYVCNECMYSYE